MKLRRQKRFVVRSRTTTDNKLGWSAYDTVKNDWYDGTAALRRDTIARQVRDLNKAHRKGWAL